MVSDDVTAIFSAVAQDIEPNLAAVIGEATRRGRKLRARRRLAVVFAASVSVLVVATAATAGAQLVGRATQGWSPAGPAGHRGHINRVRPVINESRRPVPQERDVCSAWQVHDHSPRADWAVHLEEPHLPAACTDR
jgi:hypothetical protein